MKNFIKLTALFSVAYLAIFLLAGLVVIYLPLESFREMTSAMIFTPNSYLWVTRLVWCVLVVVYLPTTFQKIKNIELSKYEKLKFRCQVIFVCLLIELLIVQGGLQKLLNVGWSL